MNLADFSPRVGFAYAVNPRVTFRGGYGIFYDGTTGNTFNNSGLAFIDFSPSASIATPLTLKGGLPSGGIASTVSSNVYAPYYAPVHRSDPYSMKYGADMQWSPFQLSCLTSVMPAQLRAISPR